MMTQKQCLQCGRFVWHNPMKKVDMFRCTYCGHPPGGNSSSDKRLFQEKLRDKQVIRARTLGLK